MANDDEVLDEETLILAEKAMARMSGRPHQFSFIPMDWDSWRHDFEIYRYMSGLREKRDVDQIRDLLNEMGPPSANLYVALQLDTLYKRCYHKVMDGFERVFLAEPKVASYRSKFFTMYQSKDETGESFANALYKLSKKCKFVTLRDDMVRDRLVLGIRNKQLSRQLLEERNLTLAEVLRVVRLSDKMEKERIDEEENRKIMAIIFAKPSSDLPPSSHAYVPNPKPVKICPGCGCFYTRDECRKCKSIEQNQNPTAGSSKAKRAASQQQQKQDKQKTEKSKQKEDNPSLPYSFSVPMLRENPVDHRTHVREMVNQAKWLKLKSLAKMKYKAQLQKEAELQKETEQQNEAKQGNKAEQEDAENNTLKKSENPAVVEVDKSTSAKQKETSPKGADKKEVKTEASKKGENKKQETKQKKKKFRKHRQYNRAAESSTEREKENN